MKKKFYKSKTVWGIAMFAVATFLVNTGWVDASWFTDLVKWFGAGWGVYGIRDALN